MRTCPVCEAANPEGYRFCGECGAHLEPAGCPSCGAPHPEDQRFCGQCGAVLGPDPQASLPVALPEQERKLATVMFVDVVGFTSLSERTDPELVARMVDAAFREMTGVVIDHGGTVDKYMGDCLMAVFGVPVAHDDDAERAVAAALSMQKVGGDLVFSIGINSGEVMATAIGRAGDRTVIGDAVNVAARLEKAAGPGEVLCGALTVELVGGRAVFRGRQPVILKGKREPVEVWEAVGLRQAGPDAPADDVPLVGRDDEMAYLRGLWQRAGRDRQFQIALICGDAGSGKTRLARELARFAAPDGTVVTVAFPAYGPMSGMRAAAEILHQLGPAADRDVMARVRSVSGQIDAGLRALEPTALQQEQMWGLGRLLMEKTAQQPLLILIDDAHRGSETMFNVIGEMRTRVSAIPLLVVLAGRNEPGDWLGRFPSATTLRLAPLGRRDAADLAAALVCDKPLAEEASRFLVERAGGNPLYLRELVRMVRARGSLVDDGDRYLLGPSAAVPATLHALLSARLDALDPSQKAVFQHAALLGPAATADRVTALAGPGAVAVLGGLVDAGLMQRGPDGTLEAVDPLLSEVAYETLPRHVRGELHHRAAAIAAEPEDRARHLERAADYLTDDAAVAAEAAEVLGELGEQFITTARFPEAQRLLERSVALGTRRPDTLFALAELQALSGDPDAAVATLSFVAAAPGDPSIAAERDHAVARARIFTDPAWARPRLVAVADRWCQLDNQVKQGWALANAGVCSFNVSRMGEAATDLERAMHLFEAAGDRGAAVTASSFLSLARPGDPRVPAWLEDALSFADESGERSKQLSALSALTWNHYLRAMWGDPSETAGAEAFARRLADLAEDLGAEDLAIHGRSLLAITMRWNGRIDEAVREAELLGRIVDRYPREPWIGWAAGFAVAVASGAVSAAPPYPPPESPDPVARIAAQVVGIELALAGRIDEALPRMKAESHDPGVPGEVAATLYALALVLAGRPAEARPVAEKASAAATIFRAHPAGRMAAALLAEIDGDPGALPLPSAGPSLAAAVILRAHVALGSTAHRPALYEAARSLAAPGLLAGLRSDGSTAPPSTRAGFSPTS